MANSSANLWLLTVVLVTIISIHQADAAPSKVDFEPNFDTRIVGGEIAEIEKFPYQVAVATGKKLLCGGSILNKNHVLTAAHCVGGVRPIEVISGTYNMVAGGEKRSVTKITMHPKFEKPTQNHGFINDIAILKVSQSFKFSKTTNAIKLYGESGKNISKYVGRQVKISGYGLTSYNGTSDGKLRFASQNIVNSKMCREKYLASNIFPAEIDCFCASDDVLKRSPCIRDSGGPLVMDDRLLGIVSRGDKCGETGLPTVYTNVAHHAQWIKKHRMVMMRNLRDSGLQL